MFQNFRDSVLAMHHTMKQNMYLLKSNYFAEQATYIFERLDYKLEILNNQITKEVAEFKKEHNYDIKIVYTDKYISEFIANKKVHDLAKLKQKYDLATKEISFYNKNKLTPFVDLQKYIKENHSKLNYDTLNYLRQNGLYPNKKN